MMKEDAEEQIIAMHTKLEEMQKEKVQYFMELQRLEKEIKELQYHLSNLKGKVYEPIYKKVERREVVKGVAPVIVESNGTIHI